MIIHPNKELLIKASATSSANDFDFFSGNWTLVNHKLKDRLINSNEWSDFPAYQKVSKILLGIGNIDICSASIDGKPFEGMSLRLFDRKTKLWSIYWADSNQGTLDKPVVGSFDGNSGDFYARDTYKGKSIIVKFNWDKKDLEHPVWSQAFSEDEGKTWEWNWYMEFSRPEAGIPQNETF
jgi:hypothetical protein